MHCTPAANGYFAWPASAIAAVPPAERFSNKINARSGHWAGISRLDGIVGRKSPWGKRGVISQMTVSRE